MSRVYDLSMMLCQTVIDTLYDIHRDLLPSSLFAKEAKKHVTHVISSLLPNEGLEKRSSRRTSRISDVISFLDASPYSRNDTVQTPDTSLLGTPSSFNTSTGVDFKRQRMLPPLPHTPSLPPAFDRDHLYFN